MDYFEVETADPDTMVAGGKEEAAIEGENGSSPRSGMRGGISHDSRFARSLKDMAGMRVWLGLAVMWLVSFAVLYSILRKIFPLLHIPSFSSSFHLRSESFLKVYWSGKEPSSLGLEVPLTLLEKPQMFIVDVMYASSMLKDGKQTSMSHMPAIDTHFNVFQLDLSPSLAKQLVLSKPLMQLRPGNKEMETCTENVRNSFQTSLAIKGATSTGFVVDASSYLAKLFLVKDAAKVKQVRVLNVTAFPNNFNIHVEAVRTVSEKKGGGESSEELIFAFQLLQEQPMPARLATNEVGYFTRTFQDLGWGDLASNYTEMYPSAVEQVDAEVRLIVRKQLPAVYYIDPSVPTKWQGAIKRGVENWQKAFDAAGIPGAVKAVLPSDADFPEDYNAADMRYSTISWSVSTDKVFAIGPATVDPRSGQVLNSDIVFAHGWVHSWLGQVDMASKLASTASSPHRLRGSPGCLKQQLTAAELGELGDDFSSINDLTKVIEMGLTDVTMHEVGHTLGLRHNFKGSAGMPYSKRTDEQFIKEYGLTTSVMDYVPMNLMSSKARGSSSIPPLFSPTVGRYDIQAIQYGYQALQSGVMTVRNQTFELPLKDPSIAKMVNKVLEYATDEDDPGMTGPDPLTTLFDFSDNPIRFFEDRLEMVREIRLGGKLPKNLERHGKAQVRLLHSVSLCGQFLSKFIGGVHMPSKSGNGILGFTPLQEQRQAFRTILLILASTGKHGFFPNASTWHKSVKRTGLACNTLASYCDGRQFLDFPSLVVKAKLGIVDKLLHPAKLDRLVMQERVDGESLLFTLFQNVTGAFLGAPIVQPFTLKDGFGPGDFLRNGELWDVQLAWMDHLRTAMQSFEKKKSFTVTALIRQERKRVVKELKRITSSTGMNKLSPMLRAHLAELLHIADEEQDVVLSLKKSKGGHASTAGAVDIPDTSVEQPN